MSKAVTHDEVEDVLSSIRRLVSEDKRPLAGLRNIGPELQKADPEVEEPAQDRLVLTPSLRVAHPRPDTPDEEDTQDLAEVAAGVDRPEQDADAGDAVPAPGEPEDIAPTINDEDMIDALLQQAFAQEVRKSANLTAPAEATADLSVSDPEIADQNADEIIFSMAGRDAVPEAGFIEVEEDWNASDPVEEDIAETVAEEMEDTGDAASADAVAEKSEEPLVLMPENARSTRMMPMDAEPSNVPVSAGGATAGDAKYAERGQSLTSKIAALEAAIGAMRQGFEPDGDETDALAPRQTPPLAWEDDVELDAHGTPLPQDAAEAEEATQPVAPTPARESAGLELDDQLMDEAALRDLVSEIVRAELQGALGERITRNVRKLVRREIHRALTAQEME